MFYIVQESLTNSIRHARASEVRIKMWHSAGQFFVTVSGDGIGFSIDGSRKENSLGLVGIEERMRALGGTFGITNNPDQGMMVTASIPLAHATLPPGTESVTG